MATRFEMIMEVLQLSSGKQLTSKEIAIEIVSLFPIEMEEKNLKQEWLVMNI